MRVEIWEADHFHALLVGQQAALSALGAFGESPIRSHRLHQPEHGEEVEQDHDAGGLEKHEHYVTHQPIR